MCQLAAKLYVQDFMCIQLFNIFDELQLAKKNAIFVFQNIITTCLM